MKLLPIVLLSFFLIACDQEKSYHLLYPIEASKQDVLRIQGYRFLSSHLDNPASIIVLSNPVENGGFADFAFAISNNTKEIIHINSKDIIVKMRDHGKLEILSHEAYPQARPYHKPEGFDRLSPKMQAFGCSPTQMQDNTEISSFTPSQSWVWDKHTAYPFHRPKLYLKELDIPAGETRGFIFRLKIPAMTKEFDQSTLLISIKTKEESSYRFKFILQSLS